MQMVPGTIRRMAKRDFVDHFHTCFVLKALAKIEELTGCSQCRSAIERGVGYYVKNLFDANGLPMPFSKRAAAHGVSPGAVRLCGVYQPGRSPAGPLSRAGQDLVRVSSPICWRGGKSPMALFGPASFCSAGTTSRCIAGLSRRCSEVSASCCRKT